MVSSGNCVTTDFLCASFVFPCQLQCKLVQLGRQCFSSPFGCLHSAASFNFNDVSLMCVLPSFLCVYVVLQPLRLEIKKMLQARSDRVKCVDVHPSEDWVLSALYNGKVFLWNYATGVMVKSFDICELPVRSAKVQQGQKVDVGVVVLLFSTRVLLLATL